MTYRAYVLRSPSSAPEDQTTTPHRGVAEAAYRLLLRRGAIGLYPPGAEAVLSQRDEGNRLAVLARSPLGAGVDPDAPLPPDPSGVVRLAVPAGTQWPVEGRAADGSMILRPGFVAALEAASGLLPGTATEDQVAGLLQSWYVARRKMDAPPCPWTEALLREVEQEDGLPPGSISGTMDPPGGYSGN